MSMAMVKRSPKISRSGRVAGYVFWCSMKIWWRRLTKRLSRWPALLLLLVLVVGPICFARWLYIIAGPALASIMGESEVASIILSSLFVTFLLVCVLVRTLLAAFDRLSIDFRLLVCAAPLTRGARAIIQLVPDVTVAAFLSFSLGLPQLLVFAQNHPTMPWENAIVLGMFGVCLVGAVGSLAERALLRLVKDASAARVGSSIILLFLICMIFLHHSKYAESWPASASSWHHRVFSSERRGQRGAGWFSNACGKCCLSTCVGNRRRRSCSRDAACSAPSAASKGS